MIELVYGLAFHILYSAFTCIKCCVLCLSIQDYDFKNQDSFIHIFFLDNEALYRYLVQV